MTLETIDDIEIVYEYEKTHKYECDACQHETILYELYEDDRELFPIVSYYDCDCGRTEIINTPVAFTVDDEKVRFIMGMGMADNDLFFSWGPGKDPHVRKTMRPGTKITVLTDSCARRIVESKLIYIKIEDIAI